MLPHHAIHVTDLRVSNDGTSSGSIWVNFLHVLQLCIPSALHLKPEPYVHMEAAGEGRTEVQNQPNRPTNASRPLTSAKVWLQQQKGMLLAWRRKHHEPFSHSVSQQSHSLLLQMKLLGCTGRFARPVDPSKARRVSARRGERDTAPGQQRKHRCFNVITPPVRPH